MLIVAPLSCFSCGHYGILLIIDNDLRSSYNINTVLRGIKTLTLKVVDGRGTGIARLMRVFNGRRFIGDGLVFTHHFSKVGIQII